MEVWFRYSVSIGVPANYRHQSRQFPDRPDLHRPRLVSFRCPGTPQFIIEHKQRRYAFLREIGSDGASRVYEAVDLNGPPEERFAIKRMDLATCGRSTSALRADWNVLAALSHPNVATHSDFFRSATHAYIVAEHAEGGTLRAHVAQTVRGNRALAAQGALTEDMARRVAQQILSALAHCHDSHIVHGNLTLDTVLLDRNGNVKLTDFGTARATPNEWRFTYCGTLDYSAPEAILTDESIAVRLRGAAEPSSDAAAPVGADMWSCGVILYAMLVGRLPFQAENRSLVRTSILNGPLDIPPYITTRAGELLRQLLEPDPATRMSSTAALHHGWMNGSPLLTPTRLALCDPGRAAAAADNAGDLAAPYG